MTDCLAMSSPPQSVLFILLPEACSKHEHGDAGTPDNTTRLSTRALAYSHGMSRCSYRPQLNAVAAGSAAAAPRAAGSPEPRLLLLPVGLRAAAAVYPL